MRLRELPLRGAGALLALQLALAGCGSSETAAPCTDKPAPTLGDLKRDVFVSCTSSSCHGPGGTAGNLDLATDPHAALVGVPPDAKGAATRGWTVPAGLVRVTPGDETRSLLYLKLTLPSAKDPLLGHRMPDTGQTLDDCSIHEVRDWIRRGAPND